VAWENAEEASAVLSAYVLIETEVGKVAHVAQALRAVLRSADLRQAEATILAWYQIVTASSWNATASRRFVGSSTASS
jgi:hypothetical protein